MRIGLAGTGPWAQRTYAPALSEHPEVEFGGVWGRRPEAASALAERFGVRAYGDFEELLAENDAVAFALPPQVQAEYALRAAEAGKHLVLDKPLAIEAAAARAVVEAAERAGVRTVVLFTFRFREPVASWIREQSALGDWFSARVDFLASLFPLGGESTLEADSPWRRERGALWDVGPHVLSILEPILGEAELLTAARGRGDTVNLTFRHDGGVTSSVTLSLTAPVGAGGVDIVLRGERGVASFPAPAPGGESAIDGLKRAISMLEKSPEKPEEACDARYALHVTELLEQAERALA